MKNFKLLGKEDKRELYVQEIIEKEKILVKNNTLILSPAGSGKSVSIKSDINKLRASGDTRPVVILSSLTALKRSQYSDFSENFFTLDRVSGEFSDLPANSVVTLTYSAISRLAKFNDELFEDIAAIYCDEIHSLFQYESYSKNDLNILIRDLFKIRSNTRVIYFTATEDAIKHYLIKESGFKRLFDKINVLDFNNREDIKRHIARSVFNYDHMEACRGYIASWKESIIKYGFKGFVYATTLRELKLWKEFLVSIGFEADRIAVIWSEHNDEKMTEEMNSVSRELVETGLIPDGYDFIIFNAAYREGWNLKDSRVKLAIIHTKDNTDRIQSLGRLRMDIPSIALYSDHTSGEVLVPQEYLNVKLDRKEKEELAEKLCVLDKNNKKMKFLALSKYLSGKGYEFEEVRIKGVRLTVISKKIEDSSYISEIEREIQLEEDKLSNEVI